MSNRSRDSGDIPPLNRTDYALALAVGIGALAVYVRTLAPDVLYADSAEFQTLAYTLGMTHSTGYPIYLLLARLFGFVPVGSLAWRVNLLSALGAAVAVGGVYLLIRHVTANRIGALLGSAALGLSYTLWSQAVIAELYTPALGFLVAIMLLLWRWHSSPFQHYGALCVAALLIGVGVGVHAFVGLILPTAAAFVLWTLWSRRKTNPPWQRSLAAAGLGLALGGAIFLSAFFLFDANNPPSSFIQVALYPSRSIWGLQDSDLASPIGRLWLTVSGRQWQDAMFPGGDDFFSGALAYYAERLLNYEFTPLMLLCALLGLEVMVRTVPNLGVFVLVAFATMLYPILNYEPPDKYIFFLPTYLFVALAIGAGASFVLNLVHGRPARRKSLWRLVLYVLEVVLLALMVIKPFGASRRQALQAGIADFVTENYAYPVYHLEEPRRTATWKLANLPDDAVLIMEWRALYTMYYLAHVEGERPDITIKEASPHGGEGMVADTLIDELKTALWEGRPVLTDRVYRGLRDHFRVRPALGGGWYRLSLPGSD